MIFLFPSRSLILGMEFSIPVPELLKVIPAHACDESDGNAD